MIRSPEDRRDVAGSLVLSVDRRRSSVTVRLEGDLDLHASGKLAEVVDWVLDSRPDAVEIDAEGVTFIDSYGLRTLFLAFRRASTLSIDVQLTRSSPGMRRIVEMTDLHEVFGMPPSRGVRAETQEAIR